MHRHRVAVMVDGGFFLKRLRHVFPGVDAKDAATVANIIHAHALRHRYQRTGEDGDRKPIHELFDLYRIFFYDCPPLQKKMHLPVSKKAIDFSKTPEANFRNQLHKELLERIARDLIQGIPPARGFVIPSH